FVAEVLTAWPDWLEDAAVAMQRAVAESAARFPEALRSDERRLAELEKQIDNLVDQLAMGASESPAVRRRLDQLEREAEALRPRIAEARHSQKSVVSMPDEAWVRAQLAELPRLLVENARQAADLLRRLLGRVTAEAIVSPGKSRGFIRLHLCFDAPRLLR